MFMVYYIYFNKYVYFTIYYIYYVIKKRYNKYIVIILFFDINIYKYICKNTYTYISAIIKKNVYINLYD